MIDLIIHYPWLPALKEYFSEIASKAPIEFIKDVFNGESASEMYERVLILFKSAFQNAEEITSYNIDQLNVHLYLVLKILLYVLDNKMITNRIANLYSKINYKEIEKEIEKENLFNLYDICEALKLDIKYNDKPWQFGKNIIKDQEEILKTRFIIHYTDYLKLAIYLKDDYRKLVNNVLSNSYVYIKETRLARLLQEYVRNKLLIEQESDKNTLKAFQKELFQIPLFKELYDTITSEWKQKEDEFEYTFNIDFEKIKDISEIYPPCILEIIKKAQEGQNLIHNERLFIVWFLIALNYPTDKIVNIFSTLPDFDRERTEYQVNYAKRKEYTPYKCSTLKSLNLCLASKYKNELCLKGYYSKIKDEEREISHPLSYINVMQYRKSKKKEENNQKIEKNNE